jgi:sulfate permease, SulP family
MAIGPTSAISLMIAGSVGAMAEGDAARYAQIASLAGFSVALLCLISWLFRLSMLVRLISDSILVGFKAGVGLTIMITQLPSVFGVASGGYNFFERAVLLTGQLGQTVSASSSSLRIAGRRLLALLGLGAMSDLSPLSARKRTLTNHDRPITTMSTRP